MKKRTHQKRKLGTLAISLVLAASLCSPMAVLADSTATPPNETAQGTGTQQEEGETPVERQETEASSEIVKNNVDRFNDILGTQQSIDGINFTSKANTRYLMYGDLSIASKQQDGSIRDYNSTTDQAYPIDKNSTYSLRAKLDVEAVHNAISDILFPIVNYIPSRYNSYVNNLETGFRATFAIDNNLSGSFYVPKNSQDAQEHYQLKSTNAEPKIYSINYNKSKFEKNKVTIYMDFDLSAIEGKYSFYSNFYDTNPNYKKLLYADASSMEYFNHPNDQYGSTFYTSTIGNLYQLISKSTKEMEIVMDGMKLNSATGNPVTYENTGEITTTTTGSIKGTLVGYMQANVGAYSDGSPKGTTAYVWGATQSKDGADSYHKTDNEVYLTVQFTEKKNNDTPTPVTPSRPISTTPTTPSKGPSTPQLNTKDHYAYVVGYPDNTVHPEGQITRAEAAAVFFRLLTPSLRESEFAKIKNGAQSAAFSDVNKGSWYYTAVAVMKDLGILSGYPDGSFNPNTPITRAEFAAIAERFNKNPSGNSKDYTDIAGHWAENQIRHAAADGWIYGYADGTFKPNNKITRAESMAIVNRVTKRYPDAAHPFNLENDPEMHVWSDNKDKSKWYYLDVQEATNGHLYHRTNTPTTIGGQTYDYNTEYWEDAIEATDWAKYNL